MSENVTIAYENKSDHSIEILPINNQASVMEKTDIFYVICHDLRHGRSHSSVWAQLCQLDLLCMRHVIVKVYNVTVIYMGPVGAECTTDRRRPVCFNLLNCNYLDKAPTGKSMYRMKFNLMSSTTIGVGDHDPQEPSKFELSP